MGQHIVHLPGDALTFGGPPLGDPQLLLPFGLGQLRSDQLPAGPGVHTDLHQHHRVEEHYPADGDQKPRIQHQRRIRGYGLPQNPPNQVGQDKEPDDDGHSREDFLPSPSGTQAGDRPGREAAQHDHDRTQHAQQHRHQYRGPPPEPDQHHGDAHSKDLESQETVEGQGCLAEQVLVCQGHGDCWKRPDESQQVAPGQRPRAESVFGGHGFTLGNTRGCSAHRKSKSRRLQSPQHQTFTRGVSPAVPDWLKP